MRIQQASCSSYIVVVSFSALYPIPLQDIPIKPDNTINDAIELMHGNNIRRLSVIDNDGKMIGTITNKDILKVAARKKSSIVNAYVPKEFDVED